MTDRLRTVLLLAIAAGLWINVAMPGLFAHPARDGAMRDTSRMTELLSQTTRIGPLRVSFSLQVAEG